MTVLPGPIRQIGYVVNDLDVAIAGWLQIGVGPWFVLRGVPIRATYRDEPCETTLTLGWANSGEMQIELIHQEDDTASIYTEFLRSNGPGYHQLAYWTENFEETMAAVRDVGWTVAWLGGEDVGTRFAYVETPNSPATIVEITELNDATAGLNQFVSDAAMNWDGSDPIRALGG
ncbi:MAG: hypothetical protein QOD39_611 [Mycobacterium sp.]|jgi:hypothetical protein|nr:hypothetical protein [Mycobacterium sp.]